MNTLSSLLACGICMGGNDSRIGPALNGAIFLMLGCIGLMLTLILSVIWSLARRARTHAAEMSALESLR